MTDVFDDDKGTGTAFAFTATNEPCFDEKIMQYLICQRVPASDNFICYVQLKKDARTSFIRNNVQQGSTKIVSKIERKLRKPAFDKNAWINPDFGDVTEYGALSGFSAVKKENETTTTQKKEKQWEHHCDCGSGWNGNNATNHKKGTFHQEWEQEIKRNFIKIELCAKHPESRVKRILGLIYCKDCYEYDLMRYVDESLQDFEWTDDDEGNKRLNDEFNRVYRHYEENILPKRYKPLALL